MLREYKWQKVVKNGGDFMIIGLYVYVFDFYRIEMHKLTVANCSCMKYGLVVILKQYTKSSNKNRVAIVGCTWLMCRECWIKDKICARINYKDLVMVLLIIISTVRDLNGLSD